VSDDRDSDTIGTIISRDHDRDPERVGLMRLVSAFPTPPQATVGRVWNRIRQARNVQALARMRKGNSMAGLPGWLMDLPELDHSGAYFAQQRIR